MPEDNINRTMSSALEILNNKDINILIRIAIFHYLFEYIHPFYDGNGRTSRFISSYLLSQNLNILTGYKLSYTIKENITKYYKSFETTNNEKNKGDLTSYIIDFLDIIIDLLYNLVESITPKYNQLEYYNTILESLFEENSNYMKISFILLQNTLFASDGLSISDISSICDISNTTTRKYVSSKKLKKYLEVTKIGNKYIYKLNLEQLQN